jgi:alpha-L-fucosidase
MKQRRIGAVILGIGAICAAPQLKETEAERDARIQWFRDAKFGLFIHWGPAALSGQEISWGMKDRIEGGAQHQKVPREEYMNLYRNFNPVKFNPDEIMALAKGAGMSRSRKTEPVCKLWS